MRVLHVASEYPPQEVFGLGRYVHGLAHEQMRQGLDVHVLANSTQGSDRDALHDGVHVHRIDFPPPPKPHLESAAVCQFNSLLLERLPGVRVKHGPFDVVNSHDWLTALAGQDGATLLDAAHVWTVHDLVVGKRHGALDNEDRFTANVERWAAGAADAVICNSEAVRRELAEVYGASVERARVVPCGIDAAALEVATPPEHLPYFRRSLAEPDEAIVLYVGRLDAEKGLDVLLNAATRVVQETPRVRFVLAGRGRLEGRIRRDVAAGSLCGRVTLAGYVGPPVLAHLYRVADVHVVPSTYEPFGIVALEGMASGLPVVVSRTGGLTDIVENDVDGLSFDPRRHDQLASALLRLLRDRALRQRLGSAGREKALSQYSWRAIAGLVSRCYEEAGVSASKRRRRASP